MSAKRKLSSRATIAALHGEDILLQQTNDKARVCAATSSSSDGETGGSTAVDTCDMHSLRSAADGGSAPSALALGMRLLLGEGCDADTVAAAHMLRKAAGGAAGPLLLTWCADDGASDSDSDDGFVVQGRAYGVPADKSSVQPPSVRDSAACGGAPPSPGGAPRSFEAALAAAQTGDAAAQNDVGVMLHTGASPEGQNSPAAKAWFARAAAQGSAEAQVNLAFMHVAGGVADTVDLPAAFKCLRAAAQAGHVAGMNDLGVMLQHGYGCTADAAAALAWFHRAAAAGSDDAKVNAGVALATGRGCKADTAAAERMLRDAAQAGHVGAAQALQELQAQPVSPMRPLRLSALDAATPATAGQAVASRSSTTSPASTASCGSVASYGAGGSPDWPEREERHILRMVHEGILDNLKCGHVQLPARNVGRLLDEKQLLRNLPWMEIAHHMPRREGKRANAKKCRAYFERVLACNLGKVALRVTLAPASASGVHIDLFKPQSAQ